MNDAVTRMRTHEKFSSFFLPVDEKTEFRDATYFLRSDGTFIFSEGYCHAPELPLRERRVVSHIVFVADGLRHVVRRSIEFDLVTNHEIERAVHEARPVQNLYALSVILHLFFETNHARQP